MRHSVVAVICFVAVLIGVPSRASDVRENTHITERAASTVEDPCIEAMTDPETHADKELVEKCKKIAGKSVPAVAADCKCHIPTNITSPCCKQMEVGASCIRKELNKTTINHYLYELFMPTFDSANLTEVTSKTLHKLNVQTILTFTALAYKEGVVTKRLYPVNMNSKSHLGSSNLFEYHVSFDDHYITVSRTGRSSALDDSTVKVYVVASSSCV